MLKPNRLGRRASMRVLAKVVSKQVDAYYLEESRLLSSDSKDEFVRFVLPGETELGSAGVQPNKG